MVIGITGGVGCGKSTVLKILKDSFGAHIIDADKVAHRLMEPGGDVYINVCRLFGDDILYSDGPNTGFINRSALGRLVFADKEKLSMLNAAVHPAVKAAITDEIAAVKSKNSKALIAVEAALFIEAGYMDICDELWYIYTDNDIRTDRLMSDRGYTREKAESIIKNQLSEDEFRKHSDFVLDNSSTREHILSQVEERLKYYGR